MASTPSQAKAPRADKSRGSPAIPSTAVNAQSFVDSHRDEGNAELFGISELCQEFDITLRALRFYEDKGLLAPRRVSARLAFILRAKAIGSPLSEIKHYLDLYGDHGEGRSQQLSFVIARTDAAIEALEQKRAQIDETLAELHLINASCRSHLASRRRAAK